MIGNPLTLNLQDYRKKCITKIVIIFILYSRPGHWIQILTWLLYLVIENILFVSKSALNYLDDKAVLSREKALAYEWYLKYLIIFPFNKSFTFYTSYKINRYQREKKVKAKKSFTCAII